MAIAFVHQNHGGTNTNSPTSVGATFGTTTTAGNFLIAMLFTNGSAGTITTPANWVEFPNSPVTNGTQVLHVYYIANAASINGATTQTFTFQNAVTSAFLRLQEYSGAATSNPIDTTVANTGTGTAITTLSITTAAANESVLGIWGQTHGGVGSAPAFSSFLNGYTDIGDVGSGADGLGRNLCTIGGANTGFASAGTNTSTGATSSVSAAWSSLLVAFSPTPIVAAAVPRRQRPSRAAREPRPYMSWCQLPDYWKILAEIRARRAFGVA